jgi:hypothetical protein
MDDEAVVLWLLPYWTSDYHPEFAPLIIEAMGELDEDVRSMIFGYMSDLARLGLIMERN